MALSEREIKARSTQTDKDGLPKYCPACGFRVKWTETKTDLYCPNDDCKGYKLDQVKGFFKALDTDAVKEGVVEQLVKDGLDNIAKIIKADVKRLTKVEGFQLAKAKKVHDGIRASLTEVPLPNLAHASGCFVNENTSLGSTRIAEIVNEIGASLLLTGDLTEIRQRLSSVRGIGPIIMDLLIAGLPDFRKFLAGIEGYYDLALPPAKDSDNAKGLVAVWTGYRDPDQEALVEANGGKVGSGVSRNTSVLFYASASSGKYKKAASMGLTCISREQAPRWLSQNVVKKRKKVNA